MNTFMFSKLNVNSDFIEIDNFNEKCSKRRIKKMNAKNYKIDDRNWLVPRIRMNYFIELQKYLNFANSHDNYAFFDYKSHLWFCEECGHVKPLTIQDIFKLLDTFTPLYDLSNSEQWASIANAKKIRKVNIIAFEVEAEMGTEIAHQLENKVNHFANKTNRVKNNKNNDNINNKSDKMNNYTDKNSIMSNVCLFKNSQYEKSNKYDNTGALNVNNNLNNGITYRNQTDLNKDNEVEEGECSSLDNCSIVSSHNSQKSLKEPLIYDFNMFEQQFSVETKINNQKNDQNLIDNAKNTRISHVQVTHANNMAYFATKTTSNTNMTNKKSNNMVIQIPHICYGNCPKCKNPNKIFSTLFPRYTNKFANFKTQNSVRNNDSVENLLDGNIVLPILTPPSIACINNCLYNLQKCIQKYFNIQDKKLIDISNYKNISGCQKGLKKPFKYVNILKEHNDSFSPNILDPFISKNKGDHEQTGNNRCDVSTSYTINPAFQSKIVCTHHLDTFPRTSLLVSKEVLIRDGYPIPPSLSKEENSSAKCEITNKTSQSRKNAITITAPNSTKDFIFSNSGGIYPNLYEISTVPTNSSSVKSHKKIISPAINELSSIGVPLLALDCEMGLVTGGKHALMRVSIVDEALCCLYDSLVLPDEPIVNYLTPYSGLDQHDMKNVTTKLNDVQQEIKQLLEQYTRGVILCGHSLNFDLCALKMYHPYVIDTSICYNLTGDTQFRKSKLKTLAKCFLGKDIQIYHDKKPEVNEDGERLSSGHDSIEDAQTVMELVLLKLRTGMHYGDVSKRNQFIFDQFNSSAIGALYRNVNQTPKSDSSLYCDKCSATVKSLIASADYDPSPFKPCEAFSSINKPIASTVKKNLSYESCNTNNTNLSNTHTSSKKASKDQTIKKIKLATPSLKALSNTLNQSSTTITHSYSKSMLNNGITTNEAGASSSASYEGDSDNVVIDENDDIYYDSNSYEDEDFGTDEINKDEQFVDAQDDLIIHRFIPISKDSNEHLDQSETNIPNTNNFVNNNKCLVSENVDNLDDSIPLFNLINHKNMISRRKDKSWQCLIQTPFDYYMGNQHPQTKEMSIQTFRDPYSLLRHHYLHAFDKFVTFSVVKIPAKIAMDGKIAQDEEILKNIDETLVNIYDSLPNETLFINMIWTGRRDQNLSQKPQSSHGINFSEPLTHNDIGTAWFKIKR